jgi:hypothetical protein
MIVQDMLIANNARHIIILKTKKQVAENKNSKNIKTKKILIKLINKGEK